MKNSEFAIEIGKEKKESVFVALQRWEKIPNIGQELLNRDYNGQQPFIRLKDDGRNIGRVFAYEGVKTEVSKEILKLIEFGVLKTFRDDHETAQHNADLVMGSDKKAWCILNEYNKKGQKIQSFTDLYQGVCFAFGQPHFVQLTQKVLTAIGHGVLSVITEEEAQPYLRKIEEQKAEQQKQIKLQKIAEIKAKIEATQETLRSLQNELKELNELSQ
jgi:hypothetical protein